jgi:hypothetical protein
MSYLLRAMGLWVWGLIAIAISISLVSLSYRTLSAYRRIMRPMPPAIQHPAGRKTRGSLAARFQLLEAVAPRPAVQARVGKGFPPAFSTGCGEQARRQGD